MSDVHFQITRTPTQSRIKCTYRAHRYSIGFSFFRMELSGQTTSQIGIASETQIRRRYRDWERRELRRAVKTWAVLCTAVGGLTYGCVTVTPRMENSWPAVRDVRREPGLLFCNHIVSQTHYEVRHPKCEYVKEGPSDRLLQSSGRTGDVTRGKSHGWFATRTTHSIAPQNNVFVWHQSRLLVM